MKRYIAWVEVTVGSSLSSRRSKWYISGDWVGSVAWAQDDPESAYHYPTRQAAKMMLAQTTGWAREMADLDWGVTQVEVGEPREVAVCDFIPTPHVRPAPSSLAPC